MAVVQNLRLINGRFPTLSSHFFTNYMNIFHKIEVQTVILRCWYQFMYRVSEYALFLTAILHRGPRNDFFFILTTLLFPIFTWTLNSLYYLDLYFYFPFLFGLLFPFYIFPFFLWTFIFSFLFGLLFNRGHILHFFQIF